MIVSPILPGEDPVGGRVPQEQAKASEMQDRKLDPSRPALLPYLLSLVEQVRSDGQSERIRRLRKWLRNSKFYEGEQYGYISPYTGRWIEINLNEVNPSEDADDDLQFVNNQFRFYVKSVRKEWVRSQTHLRVRAKSDKAEKIGAAEFANAIIQNKQATLLEEDKKQTESMYALLFGNYFRYTYYSTDVMGAVERVPIFEKTQIKFGPDTVSCPVCGNGGEYEGPSSQDITDMGEPEAEGVSPSDITDMGEPEAEGVSPSDITDMGGPEAEDMSTFGMPQVECDQCGNNMMMEEGPSANIPIPTGEYQEYQVGDVFAEIPNPMEVNVHLHARTLSQTPYLHRERLILRSVLKNKFPKAALQAGAWEGTLGSSATIRDLELSVGNQGSHSGTLKTSEHSKSFDLLKFDQVWLDVPVYSEYITRQDESLSDGTAIAAGTALKDKFPRGLYIAVVGNELLNLRNENKLDHWTHGVFDLIPSRFFGDGLEDMVEIQRQLNEVINLRFENMMANAAPNTIFNPLKIDPEGFSGKPREMNALINANAEDDIRRFVFRLEGTGLDRENFAAEESYKKDMQTLSGAFSINSGMPDVDISTATGARIVRDAAISMIGPALAIKAKVDVEWAYQVLKLCQAYWTGQRYVPNAGNHSKQAGQWFEASDISGDFEITYIPGSWMPRSETEEREDFLSFISPNVTGLPMGFLNPMVPENVRQFAAEKYRIPIGLDASRVHQRIAQGRIDNLKKAAQELVDQGLLDPDYDFEAALLAAQAPPQVQAPAPQPPPPGQPVVVHGSSELVNGPANSGAPASVSQPGPTIAPASTPVIGPAMQEAEPAPDPNIDSLGQLLKSVPVRIVVDEHMVFANYYREALTIDDLMNSPTAVQKVLEMKIVQHYLAGQQVQAYLAGIAGAMQGLTGLAGTSMPPSENQPMPGGASPRPTSSLGPTNPGLPPSSSGGAPNAAIGGFGAPTPQAV